MSETVPLKAVDRDAARRLLKADDFEESRSQSSYSEDGGTNSEDDSREGANFAERILENDVFKMCVAIAILGSTVVLALETDMPLSPVWPWVDGLLLAFFVVEITLRLLKDGWSFFYNQDWAWNIFDFAIVAFSVFDVLGFEGPHGQELDAPDENTRSTPMGPTIKVLRIVRIFRILRILRIFHQCDQLQLLANGLFESLQMVGWIAVMMFMGMLCFAIFMCEFVGDQADNFKNPDVIREYWNGVFVSVSTLFQFLTLDNWSWVTRQVTDSLPWMRPVFNAYIFLGAFAVLSLLTGVVADHMSKVSEVQHDVAADRQQKDFKTFMDALKRDFLRNARKQGIDREDFATLMNHEELKQNLESYGIEVEGHEINEFWDFLNRDGDGWLTWDEFENGIFRLHEDRPQPQDMLRMRFAAERVARTLEGGMGEAATTRKLVEVNEFMSDIDTRLATMEQQLRGFMEFARVRQGKRPTLMEALISGGSSP